MKKYFFVVVAMVLSTIMFSCKKENNNEPTTPSEPEFSAEVYPEITTRNCILLEEFTSQKCTNCPRAIKAIRTMLNAMPNGNRVAWVAHHSGYYDDAFTQKGDKTIASAFSVNYAPAAIMERIKTKAEDGDSTYDHVADYAADSTLLNMLLARPAEASIDMQAIIMSDSTLKVRMTGKCNPEEAYITIMLCQDSLLATQSGGGSNYYHCEVVRAYLTNASGDQVTINSDKTYSYTATYKLPASISNYTNDSSFPVDIKNMFVVGSIHGKLSSKGAVYNTDKIELKNAGRAK